MLVSTPLSSLNTEQAPRSNSLSTTRAGHSRMAEVRPRIREGPTPPLAEVRPRAQQQATRYVLMQSTVENGFGALSVEASALEHLATVHFVTCMAKFAQDRSTWRSSAVLTTSHSHQAMPQVWQRAYQQSCLHGSKLSQKCSKALPAVPPLPRAVATNLLP